MRNIAIIYASKRGGTRGLVDMIATEFENHGLTVSTATLPDAEIPASTNAVVIAAPIYAGRWDKQARRFVKQHSERLATLPTWLVASGPLDDSADAGALPPVPHLAKAAERVRARGTQTFGGRLRQAAPGLLAGQMAKTHAGDWRSSDHVVRWVQGVVSDVS